MKMMNISAAIVQRGTQENIANSWRAPRSQKDMDRLRLFRVTQYQVRSATPVDGGDGLLQTVEIKIFNKHQARERTVIDEQHWKYNPDTERWQLHSGLPDPTRGR